MTPVDAANVALRALISVTEGMTELGQWLRSIPAVDAMQRDFSINREEPLGDGRVRVGQGTNYRVEWYADARFENGSSLSYCQEAIWDGSEWVIAASVNCYGTAGEEEEVMELPTRFAVEVDELRDELLAQTAALLRQKDVALQAFLKAPGSS